MTGDSPDSKCLLYMDALAPITITASLNNIRTIPRQLGLEKVARQLVSRGNKRNQEKIHTQGYDKVWV